MRYTKPVPHTHTHTHTHTENKRDERERETFGTKILYILWVRLGIKIIIGKMMTCDDYYIGQNLPILLIFNPTKFLFFIFFMLPFFTTFIALFVLIFTTTC